MKKIIGISRSHNPYAGNEKEATVYSFVRTDIDQKIDQLRQEIATKTEALRTTEMAKTAAEATLRHLQTQVDVTIEDLHVTAKAKTKAEAELKQNQIQLKTDKDTAVRVAKDANAQISTLKTQIRNQETQITRLIRSQTKLERSIEVLSNREAELKLAEERLCQVKKDHLQTTLESQTTRAETKRLQREVTSLNNALHQKEQIAFALDRRIVESGETVDRFDLNSSEVAARQRFAVPRVTPPTASTTPSAPPLSNGDVSADTQTQLALAIKAITVPKTVKMPPEFAAAIEMTLTSLQIPNKTSALVDQIGSFICRNSWTLPIYVERLFIPIATMLSSENKLTRNQGFRLLQTLAKKLFDDKKMIPERCMTEVLPTIVRALETQIPVTPDPTTSKPVCHAIHTLYTLFAQVENLDTAFPDHRRLIRERPAAFKLYIESEWTTSGWNFSPLLIQIMTEFAQHMVRPDFPTISLSCLGKTPVVDGYREISYVRLAPILQMATLGVERSDFEQINVDWVLDLLSDYLDQSLRVLANTDGVASNDRVAQNKSMQLWITTQNLVTLLRGRLPTDQPTLRTLVQKSFNNTIQTLNAMTLLFIQRAPGFYEIFERGIAILKSVIASANIKDGHHTKDWTSILPLVVEIRGALTNVNGSPYPFFSQLLQISYQAKDAVQAAAESQDEITDGVLRERILYTTKVLRTLNLAARDVRCKDVNYGTLTQSLVAEYLTLCLILIKKIETSFAHSAKRKPNKEADRQHALDSLKGDAEAFYQLATAGVGSLLPITEAAADDGSPFAILTTKTVVGPIFKQLRALLPPIHSQQSMNGEATTHDN